MHTVTREQLQNAIERGIDATDLSPSDKEQLRAVGRYSTRCGVGTYKCCPLDKIGRVEWRDNPAEWETPTVWNEANFYFAAAFDRVIDSYFPEIRRVRGEVVVIG